jgi:AmiR/NasT family two-component response regulator
MLQREAYDELRARCLERNQVMGRVASAAILNYLNKNL